MKIPREFIVSEKSGILMFLFQYENVDRTSALKEYCSSLPYLLLYFEGSNYQVVLIKATCDYYKAESLVYDDFSKAGFEPLPDFHEMCFSVIEVPDCFRHAATIYNENAEFPCID